MATIRVTPVAVADSSEAARLLHAMERHYEGAGAASEARGAAALEGVLLPGGPWLGMILARADATAVGFATFSVLCPTEGFRPGLFVKDLFVCGSRRRTGVGMALLGALAREARRRGCVRIDWTHAGELTHECPFINRRRIGGSRGGKWLRIRRRAPVRPAQTRSRSFWA